MEWECCKEYDWLVWSASLQCMCLWMALYRRTLCSAYYVFRFATDVQSPNLIARFPCQWPIELGRQIMACGDVQVPSVMMAPLEIKGRTISSLQVASNLLWPRCLVLLGGVVLLRQGELYKPIYVHNYFSVHLLTEKRALCPAVIFSFAAVLTLVRLLVAWVTLS